MAPAHQFRRGKAYKGAAGQRAAQTPPRTVATLSARAPLLTPAQIGRINAERDEFRRQGTLGPDDPATAARIRNASLQGVPTWCGRAVSRWSSLGYWSQDGELIYVTRIM